MNTTYGKCSLYLCPRQHDFSADNTSSFIAKLQEIGFISRKTTTGNNTDYYTGNKFLDYIAYLGCSPAIQFEPGANGETYCSIKIHQFASPRLIYSKTQSATPHCSSCRKPLKNRLNKELAAAITCSHCHATLNLAQLNWRKMAGYAQLFIEVTDIFPKEAIPQQLLLDKLSATTDTGWLYFYSCQ